MKSIKASELDKKFDDGEDILEYFDTTKLTKPNESLKRINVDFPLWMLKGLDKKAKHLGVNRQAILKIWVAEKLGDPDSAIWFHKVYNPPNPLIKGGLGEVDMK